jgi:hypothetical protein
MLRRASTDEEKRDHQELDDLLLNNDDENIALGSHNIKVPDSQ